MNIAESVPKMVWFSSAATHDHILLGKLKLSSNTINVLDKHHNNHKTFNEFSKTNTGFVTRIKYNTVYDIAQENIIDERIHCGDEKTKLLS
ncbi:MAG TPA: hypothetical protein DG754_10810 [Bacteroidales bacterium]|jgi:hypothetical protein|nr:hypothetical protein [Bacteroidales bacterium]